MPDTHASATLEPGPDRAALRALHRASDRDVVPPLLEAATLRAGGRRAGAGAGGFAGPRRPRRAPAGGRCHRLSEGIWPRHQRGDRAHVPRGGAAAHPRRGDRRCADRGPHRDGRLAGPSRAGRQPCGERLGLGVHAHGTGADTRRRRAHPIRHRPPCPPPRRAGDPHRVAPGHADAGPAVRDGPHDRRGAGAGGEPAGAALALQLRHARRGGAHRGRRCALYARLRRRDRRDRAGGGRTGSARGARHLRKTVGVAPAVRAVAGRALRAGLGRLARRTGSGGETGRHRPYGRRRGSRPTGDHA